MKVLSLVPVLAGLLATAEAHTTVYGLWVNGQFRGDGRNVYVRSPPNNNPVKNLQSTDIICNVNGARTVSQSLSVPAGANLEFEWHHNTRGDDIIDGSHKGPVLVYIASRSSNGNGGVWTKIAHDGLSGGLWAVDRLKSNGGKHSVVLPQSLRSGDYLIRAEIIGLHESEVAYTSNNARGAQFYPSCSQITVTGSGSATPNQNFNFIGGYQYNHPGITFNIYNKPTSYTIPGPDVWRG